MPWSNQGGSGGGGGGPWGRRRQGPVGLRTAVFRSASRPIWRKSSAAARIDCAACCRAAISAARVLRWLRSLRWRCGEPPASSSVEPDELGVVLRFGKDVREVQPGLNYHLPYPIETVLTPKALRVNKIDIGMRVVDDARRGSATRDVPEESLMLTGDENIVDVDFSVLWKIKPTGVGQYLFNIQNPEGTVKAVAEGAMREVVGRSDIQPILTGARQNIENAVQELMQKTLDTYGAGILVQQVQLQKVDPPTQVIDAFRDVQAARADLERSVNEAQTYANRVVPEARGRVAQITQAAEAYKSQTVAEANGQTSRFPQHLRSVQEGTRGDARAHVSRDHGARARRRRQGHHRTPAANGGGGVVPYLPLRELDRPATTRRGPRRSQAMRLNFIGGIAAVLVVAALIIGYCRFLPSIRRSRRWWFVLVSRFAWSASLVSTSRCPSLIAVIVIDKRILDLEAPAQEVIASDQKRLVVDAFARYRIKRPAALLSDARLDPGRQLAAYHPAELGAASRARRGDSSPTSCATSAPS